MARPHPPSVNECFAWDYLDAGGATVGRSDSFDGRETAEEWMGLAWEDLMQRGVEEVVLVDLERGDAVYRMDLSPE